MSMIRNYISNIEDKALAEILELLLDRIEKLEGRVTALENEVES